MNVISTERINSGPDPLNHDTSAAYYWPQLSSHQTGHYYLSLHHIIESTCWSYFSKAVGFESLLKIGFQPNVKILYYHHLQYVVHAVLKIIFSTVHNNVESRIPKYIKDTFIEEDLNNVEHNF